MTRTFGTFFALAVVGFLSACSSVTQQDENKSSAAPATQLVDFQEIRFFVTRAASAYDDPEQIKADYPNLKHLKTIDEVEVQYFIERRNGVQNISIRGTADRENLLEDFRVALVPDRLLGVKLHKGFREGAVAVLNDARPHLSKSQPVRLTGHSLGGAIAVILAAYLEAEGYEVSRLMTFGQPRVTTDRLDPEIIDVSTRVVNGSDVVPMVPPAFFFLKYRHFGPEVILFDGPNYVFINSHDAERLTVGLIWRKLSTISLERHHVDNYVENISQKAKGKARQVTFSGATVVAAN